MTVTLLSLICAPTSPSTTLRRSRPSLTKSSLSPPMQGSNSSWWQLLLSTPALLHRASLPSKLPSIGGATCSRQSASSVTSSAILPRTATCAQTSSPTHRSHNRCRLPPLPVPPPIAICCRKSSAATLSVSLGCLLR